MKRTRLTIYGAVLILGLILFVHGGISYMETAAVWSGFKTFAGLVQRDEGARHVLEYGGEIAGFDYLLDRVMSLGDDWLWIVVIGFVLACLSGAGLLSEIVAIRDRRLDGSGAEAEVEKTGRKTEEARSSN